MKKNEEINENIEFPWQKPKSSSEDPRAPEEVQAIMDNPSYILPVEDSDFIKSDEARGVRLQLDYLKAEIKLQEYGVESTIVVFGSARVMERESAIEKLAAIQNKLEESGESVELFDELTIAETMVRKSYYYDEARKFGQLVGKSGENPDDCRVTIMTGGGPGIMEAANRGAFDVGAKSIGLNIQLPHEQFPNPYITPGLCFQFHYFAIRKLHFMRRAKALVVFPGGFGTLDEFFETITLIQTKKYPLLPIVLVCQKYWSRVIDFEFLKEEGVITSQDLDLFAFAEDAEEAWSEILKWHEVHQSPLF
ncbi:MAG: LOG family protein [Campylobacterota bacterium]|nr:LOG family protein [Campylobacterota bacterium]